MGEEQNCETPLEELMESDLKHYEEASSAVHTWHSAIPQAIRFYYKDRIALKEQIKELKELLIQINKHCYLGELTDRIKQVLKK